MTTYLTELEEYISSFITFLAMRDKHQDAHISALPLDHMTSKDFKAEPIAIDAPNATDFVSMEDETNDEEVQPNMAAHYRKYEEMAKRGFFNNNAARR